MRSGLFIFGALVLFFGGTSNFAQAQEQKIQLKNPSFEDTPRHSQTPRDWIDCGFPGESEPDVQPSGEFGVTMLPQDGDTYLGLVVRDNSTWERVSQRLSGPMEGGKCYEFSIYLAKSPQYLSQSRVTEEKVNYVRNAKLRIYGGFSPCHRQQLLAESPLISSYNWRQFNFKFEPTDDFTYITFEAFYQTPNLFPYNGNILLDNASALTVVPCKEKIVAVTKPPVNPSPGKDTSNGPKTAGSTKRPPVENPKPRDSEPSNPIKTPVNTTTVNTTPKAPKVIENPNLDTLNNFSKGQTIRIRSIVFTVNDTTLNRSSYVDLDKLNNFLKQNDKVVIEIGGHTNGLCDDAYCNSLSLRRARAVANYLIKNGITSNRLEVKGYGKTQPLSAVKNDPLNQRVEIKILDL
ncbi:MAG: OmpA family protein [Haliscomenobacter sp.]|uniref:OmpA family protein n=1 Tax=Haliscomenobacter sp. TaxID=2717303 RepID=UPI0029BCAD7D|nr:OmpA family protein [Haliscomenobacter sp.]MDX2070258.1 OmpA family protein [Haliscomenobacter sp.]